MSVIENFGAFVLRNFWIFWILFMTTVMLGVYHFVPKTVSLTEKNWECTMAVPDGISTRCVEYVWKGKSVK